MPDALGPLAGRVAAAPISWGVCEVPGWGAMLPADRVLAEMSALGLTATELGAPGFLPADDDALTAVLAAHGMSLVGGFVPLVLHRRELLDAALSRAEAAAQHLAAHGATRFVTAVVEDDAWSRPVPLGADGMKLLGEGLARVDEICTEHGIQQVLHPHVGTLVETRRDVELALEHTDVAWCLDTGHLRVGGFPPAEFASAHGSRVGHVHLKDVSDDLAPRVLGGTLTLLHGVQEGLFRALGDGDVAVADVIVALESQGYSGWYVLEQDTALTMGLPAPGTGPVEDVRRSVDFLVHHVVPLLGAARHVEPIIGRTEGKR